MPPKDHLHVSAGPGQHQQLSEGESTLSPEACKQRRRDYLERPGTKAPGATPDTGPLSL